MTDDERIQNIDVLLNAICKHCKDADETARRWEQKEALLTVLNAIQLSATELMQRTISEESACDTEMIVQYLNEVLTRLVKTEDAYRGRCLRCYDYGRTYILQNGDLVCEACAAEMEGSNK